MFNLQQALEFSLQKHANQKRKGAPGGLQIPYALHVFEVTKTAFDLGCRDEEYLKGFVGHDLLEDTDSTFDEITEKFGPIAAAIIEQMTFYKSRYPKKEDYMASFYNKSIVAVFGKIVDRLVNVKDFLQEDPAYAIKYFNKASVVFDAWEKRSNEARTLLGFELFDRVSNEISKMKMYLYDIDRLQKR